MHQNDRKILIDEIAGTLVLNDPSIEKESNSFKSTEMLKNQKFEEVKAILESGKLQNKIVHAVEVIDECMNYRDYLSEEEAADLKRELGKIQEGNFDHAQGASYQKMFDIGDSALLHLYKVAKRLFLQGKVTEAEDVFLFLMALNPAVADFYNGLGLCYQSRQEFQEAFAFFTLATTVDPNHIPARISAIRCCDQMGDSSGSLRHQHELERIKNEDSSQVELWSDVMKNLEK